MATEWHELTRRQRREVRRVLRGLLLLEATWPQSMRIDDALRAALRRLSEPREERGDE